MRPSLRFTRFSASVSSRPRGFFFRLARLRHRRLVPLEAAVLVQDGSGRVRDVFAIRDALVRCPADVGPAQELDAPAVGIGDDDVLVAVGLLAAAVVRGLFLRVFGPLPPPLRPVDDVPGLLPARRRAAGERLRVTLGRGAQRIEPAAQQGQEPPEPVMSGDG